MRNVCSWSVVDFRTQLKHLDVICGVRGSEVRRWRVSEIIPREYNETFDVRLHEWPRIVVNVKACRLHKHSELGV
jgi:hypothetical protein